MTPWTIIRTVSKGDYTYAVVTPEHPNATSTGYVLEHRVVMENHLGRLLTRREVVHHRDENKKNNDLSNLEVMTKGQHTRHHARPAAWVDLTCGFCTTPFRRRANQRPEVKGATHTFCTRRCYREWQKRRPVAPRATLAPISVVCAICDHPFELTPSSFRLRTARSVTGELTCSRSCGVVLGNRSKQALVSPAASNGQKG